jgi:beta-lactamase class A
MTSAALLHRLRAELADGGLCGSFLVRDLHTGLEIGLDPDLEFPSASLVKIPLAAATLERIRGGELDGATRLEVEPGRITAQGPTGLTRFRHPARVAIDDLLYLSVAISDGTASDTLFELTPPDQVTSMLRDWDVQGITVRHFLDDLTDTPAERFEPGEAYLAQSLAIGATTAGRGHQVPQLDTTRASSGSARAFVALLQALWTPSKIDPEVCGRLRELMSHNVVRHRLTPDFASDATLWSAKTGTLLNLRHEVGVAQHQDGSAYAVAALTESTVPAVIQPEAEALMSRVARALHDHLRAA